MNIYEKKNLHNRLPTVLHGFLLVASLNHLAISEDGHKETPFPYYSASSVSKEKISKKNLYVERASWGYLAGLGVPTVPLRQTGVPYAL